MVSTIVSLRLPPKLYAAAAAAAAAEGLEVGAYVRRLVESDTGVRAGPMAVGLAGADDQTRAKVSRAGTRARKKRARTKS